MPAIKNNKRFIIMRKLFSFIAVITVIAFSSCVKNNLVVWTGTQIEFDAASWNVKATGLTYPVLNRVPTFGVAVTAPNSPTLLTRTTAPFQLRINLVGPQSSTDTPISYSVVSSATTAVAGVHYAALSGTTVIPANSSFGYITITPLNPGATSGSVTLVLQLNNSTVKANVNYNTVGLSIAQN